ncbi:MAG: serine hydrolase domain-containing protein [bacterium]
MSEGKGRGKWVVATLALFFMFIHVAGLTWGSERERSSRLARPSHFHVPGRSRSLAKETVDAYDAQDLDTESDLDSYIQQRLDKVNIPGLSALIVKDGKIAWSGAYGWARIGRQPVTTDTVFQLASVSKTIVAVAVMKAWEEGRFDLDEDINRYLPFSVRNPRAPVKPITTRMLLTHTSSIRDRANVMDSAYVWNRDSPVSLGQFLEDYFTSGRWGFGSRRSFYSEDPGTAFHYSNIGAALAAYLVEATSGVPFDTYCNLKIFQPLGMEETSWRLSDLDDSHLAMPYGYDSQRRRYTAYGFYGYPDYPDGLLRSSAPQLARFLNMFIQYGELDGVRILKKETVEEMRRVQNPSIDPQGGLIWYYKELSGWRLLGHNGGDMGITTEMFFRPDDGAGIILLMNGDCTPSVDRFIKDIQTRLFKEAEYK